MRTTNRNIIQTVMESDPTVTDHQRESALAVLDGNTPPTIAMLLKQSEVAAMLNVSRQTIWSMTKRGVLKTIQLGESLIRYKRDDVLALINGEMAVA